MKTKEFNEKYKAFIEPGFEDQGLEFEYEIVTSFLDEIFGDLTLIPGFQYSQIKLKFGQCRFYTNLKSVKLSSMIENRVDKLIPMN